MPRDRLVLVHDAYEAARKIRRFLDGKSFEDYDADELLQSAVERQFEIVGEALNVARSQDPFAEDEITNLAAIVRTRNFLAHAYHAVVNERLWSIAQDHLPLLISELKGLLDRDPLEDDSL